MSRANFVQVQLAAAATSSQTLLSVKAPVGGLALPPADGGRLVLTDSPGRPTAYEIITYTSRTGSGPYTLNGVTRGVEGTSGLPWAADTFVIQSLTVGELDELLAGKVDKTAQVIAGTGLEGGGDLTADRTLSVKYGTTAGTAAEGNDSRLSNSREWTASTVTQAEAEAGTATTRSAWTAQRVRQAIVAWWNGSADKTKLDGIEAGAQVNTVASVAGKTGAVSLSKSDVGLSAVDNTSDANKPVSAAQQAALNLKADKTEVAQKRDLTNTSFPRYDLASTATTATLNLATSQVFRVAASSPRALVFTNELGADRAMTVVVHITGNSAVTWPAGIDWDSGAAPKLGDNETKVVLFWDGTGWSGFTRVAK